MGKAQIGLAVMFLVAGCGMQDATPSASHTCQDSASAVALATSCTEPSPLPRIAEVEALVGPWQATPIALSEGTIRQLDAECQAFDLFAPSVSLVVVDARGQGRVILHYAGDDGHDGTCESTAQADGSFLTRPASHTNHPQTIEVVPLERYELRVHGGMGSPGSAAPADRWLSVTGEAGPGISQVVAELPDQSLVEASMGGGWFVLWWPTPVTGEHRLIGLNDAGEEVASLTER